MAHFNIIRLPEANTATPVGVSNNACEVTEEFLFAGNAQFEVVGPSGRVIGYKVKRRRTEYRGQEEDTNWFLVRDNSDGYAYSYIGVLETSGKIRVTAKNQTFLPGTSEYDVAQWAVRVILGKEPMDPEYCIRHLGKCGKCTRMLDDSDKSRGICAMHDKE